MEMRSRGRRKLWSVALIVTVVAILCFSLILGTASDASSIDARTNLPRYPFQLRKPTSNLAIVTASTSGRLWQPCSSAIQATYARKFGHDYYSIDLSSEPKPPLYGRCTGLVKFDIISELFSRGYDKVFWMDDDAFFVNLETPLTWIEQMGGSRDLIIARDMSLMGYSSVNDGVMLWRNTEWSNEALRRVWSAYNHPYWKVRSWLASWTHSCDQAVLDSLVVRADVPDALAGSKLERGQAILGNHVAVTDHLDWNQWFDTAKFIRHLAGTKDSLERAQVIAAAAFNLSIACPKLNKS
eukprot:TRINITY_DN4326_c0_g1_i1.p1 TRINITY_DN4326_c0_g1~~TRINITY_DN4326_c0_g1_i1.p1  ORF type:complete len:297 (+),score=24.06 TRINITY_DN4326_c0_g1_i1:114-1004(+)